MTSTSENKLPIIAAFDFDGTITYRDTLVPFIIYSRGWFRLIWAVMRHFPLLCSYMLGNKSRQEVKETFLTQLFQGFPISQVREWGLQFAETKLAEKIRPAALKRLQWHQKQGHQCVLVSANLDVYLNPWAEKMGFERVITSIVASDAESKVTGKLVGANCWGPEKKKRLDTALGSRNRYLLYAYGDSLGDKEMLAYADYPFYNLF